MVSATSNVLATIGTVCWCVQLIPQIYYNYKRKNTEGFPELMSLLWCLCAPFFAVFVVVENASIPIMLQPHLFGFFCTIVYIQVMYYPPVSRPKKQIILRAGSFILFQICLEIGCIIPLRKVYQDGITFPTLIFGIIASILIALGLIPPYFELWKRNGRVVGINFLFLAVDLSGAIFSLASLAVDPSDLDIMGLVLYIICASLEVGIFTSQIIWLIRFKLFKRSKSVNDIENNSDINSTENDVENDVEYIEENKDNESDIDNDELNSHLTINDNDFKESKILDDNKLDKENGGNVIFEDLSPFQTLKS